MSGVDTFVNAHPMGFDMPVHERGEGLSGGQRQAIGVARALLLPSPIVLMDEPSNAMDSANEARLIASLKQVSEGVTLLMVSHKQNLLELTDRFILLDNGRVVLDDTRAEAMAKLQQKRSNP